MLVLGTMSWGAQTDYDEAQEMFCHAIERGVTIFDTSESYNGGESERMLGKMMPKLSRQHIQVHTKIGYDLSKPLDVRKSVEGCLKRLGTDYIDTVYLHRYGSMADRNKHLGEMVLMQSEGLLRQIGVSNCAAWQVQPCVSTIQPQYSLLKRQAEVELFPMAYERGLKVYTYSPLARGLLAGKLLCDLDPRYQRRFEDGTGHLVNNGMPTVAMAISWARSHPVVTGVIIGPSNLIQLKVCLESTDKMSAEERQSINIIPDPAPADDRPEERVS